MSPEFYDLMIPIMIGLMAIYILTIGFRGVLIRRPFLVSNGWWQSILFVVFIAMIILSFSLSIRGSFYAMNWVIPLMVGLLLLRGWIHYRGYMAYGVTENSFRDALLAALQKLQLPYEESLSVIRLTSVEATLQVSVQPWMGTGIIRVKQRSHKPVLREVVKAMDEYFRLSSVPANTISCVFNLVTGAIVVIAAIDMSFFRFIF